MIRILGEAKLCDMEPGKKIARLFVRRIFPFTFSAFFIPLFLRSSSALRLNIPTRLRDINRLNEFKDSRIRYKPMAGSTIGRDIPSTALSAGVRVRPIPVRVFDAK